MIDNTLPPPFDDPLLQCLVILTKIYNRPCSGEALKAGLPLVNHRFTPELFIRACPRAQLSARLVKRELTEFSPLVLPAVLLLKDGHAGIFSQYLDKKHKKIQFVLPETGDGTLELTLKELQSNYSGYALLVRPAYPYDARTQDPTPARSPRGWFWGTILKSWNLYAEVLVASLLINLFALTVPLFVMNVYDRVVPNQALETLWVLAIGVAIVLGFDLLVRSLRGYFIDMAGRKTDILLASRLFEQVLGTKRQAQPRSVGTFANHLHEFETLRDFFTSATLATFLDIPFVALFILVIWSIHPQLALIPVATIPVALLISLLLQWPLRTVVKQAFRTGAQKQALLIETLTGVETLKVLRAEGLMQQRWEQLVGHLAHLSLKSRFLSALAVNLTIFVQQLTTVAIVVRGVYLIAENQLTTGGLIACTILAGRALAPLAQVASLLTRYHQSLTALQALDHIMHLPQERPPKQQFLHRPPLQGHIEFKQVTFSYPEQASAALTQVSLKIQAGERWGIVGRIGSGKSTVAKLLVGLYQPTQGCILLDGVDSRQLDPADLRRYIGYVPQDSLLFYGTVRDNLVMSAPYVDDSLILRAAQLAGVDEFVNRHPQGFDMPVGERGEGLSGGQRQSIVLARALLLNPPLLILDEPTQSLDNRAEAQFKARLLPYLEQKTLLLVTHRSSLLTLVDNLVVIDGGQVVAYGAKEAVLQALASGKVGR